MPLTANFSASQDVSDLSVLQLEDTSTGSDGTLTTRLVTIQKYDGTYLLPASGYIGNYIEWAIGNDTVDIDCLDKDYGLLITVRWLAGSSIAYTKALYWDLSGYGEVFDYSLVQAMAANPKLINYPNFFNTKMQVRVLLDSAEQAVSMNDDLYACQAALEAAKNIKDNKQAFY